MVDFNITIDSIRKNNGFNPNEHESSFYRVYTVQNSKPIQVRVSNHGTHLWSWLDKDYDPSTSINISIVFTENGITTSNCYVDKQMKRNFEVVQYIYNCSKLTPKDVALINRKIITIPINKDFSDPLASTDKAAKKEVLKSNNNNIKENKNSMRVRITESKLNRIIENVVSGVMKQMVREKNINEGYFNNDEFNKWVKTQ